MKLLIHAEVDKLAGQWQHRAAEVRAEITREDDDTDLAARVRADELINCARELSALNQRIEAGG